MPSLFLQAAQGQKPHRTEAFLRRQKEQGAGEAPEEAVPHGPEIEEPLPGPEGVPEDLASGEVLAPMHPDHGAGSSSLRGVLRGSPRIRTAGRAAKVRAVGTTPRWSPSARLTA